MGTRRCPSSAAWADVPEAEWHNWIPQWQVGTLMWRCSRTGSWQSGTPQHRRRLGWSRSWRVIDVSLLTLRMTMSGAPCATSCTRFTRHGQPHPPTFQHPCRQCYRLHTRRNFPVEQTFSSRKPRGTCIARGSAAPSATWTSAVVAFLRTTGAGPAMGGKNTNR